MIAEPITNDCSRNANAFLPSDSAADSSSRIALSTRPHGERTIASSAT
ncbi:MAG: hypothetical protein LKCHEGNO_00461 [Burkholderiaceae bacterium]|nr:hypothetical protein [Burkholderiaceae bacterium]